MLTLKEKEALVKNVANGCNTIGELQPNIPHIIEEVTIMQGHPHCLVRPIDGEIWDTRTHLELCPAGEDILYQLNKENHNNIIIILSLIAATIAATCSVIDILRNL